MQAGVTVLGNLSIDLVDGGPPSAGGCPSFAGVALAGLRAEARIVVRAAPDDLPTFAAMIAACPVPVSLVPATSTSAFSLIYSADGRAMTVERVGPQWTPEDIAAAAVGTRWVHVAPLLRSDFPSAAIAALAAGGHLISYDGQGLLRVPALGSLRTDSDFDRGLLAHLQVLNISEDEAGQVFGGPMGALDVGALAVPEVLVTRGIDGCDVYVNGRLTHVPVAWPVHDVQTTGAGDMFTVSYVAARAQDHEPVAAAISASRFVAEQLSLRAAH